MTPQEHLREAEECLDLARRETESTSDLMVLLAMSQTHVHVGQFKQHLIDKGVRL